MTTVEPTARAAASAATNKRDLIPIPPPARMAAELASLGAVLDQPFQVVQVLDHPEAAALQAHRGRVLLDETALHLAEEVERDLRSISVERGEAGVVEGGELEPVATALLGVRLEHVLLLGDEVDDLAVVVMRRRELLARGARDRTHRFLGRRDAGDRAERAPGLGHLL